MQKLEQIMQKLEQITQKLNQKVTVMEGL